MKVGIFVELYRPHLSGVVVAVETLVEQLRLSGHQVFLFAPYVPGYKDNQDFPVIRVPSFYFWGQRFAFPWASQKIIDLTRELHLDLIHIQGPYPTGFLGIWLARKLGLPVVMTFHTHILLYLKIWTKFWNLPLSLFFQILALWAIRWTGRRCQLIIAPSHFIKNVLQGYGVRTRIEVLPSGVRLPESLPDRDQARSQLGLSENGQILVYSGRIAKEKNLRMLIEAFKQVLAKRDDVTLVLLGDGPFRPKLEQIIRRNSLRDKVILTGLIPHNQVWSYLAAANIFVFPSITETQGVSVSEAMSVGLPVVVTNQGGAAELVDDGYNGLMVDNDSRQFALTIFYLLENPAWAYFLGLNAKEKVRQIDPGITCQKMVGCYCQVIENFTP